MNIWMMITIVALCGMALEAYKAKHRAKSGITVDMLGNEKVSTALPPAKPELEREVVELRERVKVLERIVTDNRHSDAIAREIEDLRQN